MRALTGHSVHIFSLGRPLLSALHRLYRFQAHPLDRWRGGEGSLVLTWQSFVLWLDWYGFLSASWVGRSPMWCFVQMPRSGGTVCSVPQRLLRSSRRTCFRERWRFRTREIPHTLPVRHADEVVRLGALSPLGGHSRDNPEEQDSSCLARIFGRTFPKRSRLGMVIGTTVKACAPAGLLCELPAPKQRRLKSVWEPSVVSLQHGETFPGGTPSSKVISSFRRQFT